MQKTQSIAQARKNTSTPQSLSSKSLQNEALKTTAQIMDRSAAGNAKRKARPLTPSGSPPNFMAHTEFRNGPFVGIKQDLDGRIRVIPDAIKANKGFAKN